MQKLYQQQPYDVKVVRDSLCGELEALKVRYAMDTEDLQDKHCYYETQNKKLETKVQK